MMDIVEALKLGTECLPQESPQKERWRRCFYHKRSGEGSAEQDQRLSSQNSEQEQRRKAEDPMAAGLDDGSW